ncbi:ComF family protein [Jeotgalibacillus sp. ET6]|uniref:ComF family protein n=1 Tax=Jeotgalibacillus sp. ET6 TaxID=3037260 RepID=UPI002418BA7E|nr:ComF family protein [Jeotgalibacillus sp. ET6]MDG5471593.1 ComF family protein [Jeotgalibacillus sp. ET6]
MNRCLSCHEPILIEISWSDLFTPRKHTSLCSECMSLLQVIRHDSICTICSRPLAEQTFSCKDCLTWAEHPVYSSVLHQNRSLYVYNEGLKELIKRFKYDRDYAIAGCFSAPLAEVVKSMMPYDFLLPIPLHESKKIDRTFNQTEALLESANLPYRTSLSRMDNPEVSQAKKGKQDRHAATNPFWTAETFQNESIILIDDLYTTGTTIRHAAYILKEAGAGKICSITIGR